MRRLMQGEKPTTYPSSSPTLTPQKSPRRTNTSTSPNYSVTTSQHLRNRTQPVALLSPHQDKELTHPPSRGLVPGSPALEKLHGLEKEHLKLSASQTQAEVYLLICNILYIKCLGIIFDFRFHKYLLMFSSCKGLLMAIYVFDSYFFLVNSNLISYISLKFVN